MPTLSQDQIDEMEHTFIDLLDQLEEATHRADVAEAEVRRIKAAFPELG